MRERVQAQAHADHVHIGGRLEPFDVPANRPPQAGELGAVRALQAAVGGLERDQRSLEVARKLQLLAAHQEDLLHLRQDALVPVARQLQVQALQRQALILRLGQPALQHADLVLEIAQRSLGLGRDLAAFLVVGVGLDQPAREVVLQLVEADTSVQPDRAQERQADQRLQRYANRTGG